VSEVTPYEQIGGEPAVRAVLQTLYDQLFVDPIVGFLFEGKDKARLVEQQLAFTCRFLGGPQRYTGKPLPEAHAALPILPGHFDRRRRLLVLALEEHRVPAEVQQAWLAIDLGLRASTCNVSVPAKFLESRALRCNSFGMHDQGAELLDPDLLKDAESTSQLAAQSVERVEAAEELKTIRLPPATPPPPPMHIATSSMPPLPASFPPAAPLPSMSAGSTQPLAAHYRAAPPAASRPTWLRALLDSTFPASEVNADPEVARRSRRTAAAACVGFALAFALVAMITGLRGAPDDASMAPAVAAALVVAHALVALGAGAFSFGLLRMAERLLGE
jgi:hemoglobin